MHPRDAANGSARRLEQVYATRTGPGLPLLADAICWAVRERVAVQIKAEFPVLIRIRRRLERQDQREDGSELGQDCRTRKVISMRGASLPATRLLTFDLRFWGDELKRPLRFLQHDAVQADQRGILGSFH